MEKRDYLTWFSSLSIYERYVPISLIIIYLGILTAIGDLGSNQLGLASAVIILSYGGSFLSKIGKFILPFVLTGIAYDGHKHFLHLRPDINVSEPYIMELLLFGITWNGAALTPNQFLGNFLHPVLDVVVGIYYLMFLFIFIGIAAYFYFYNTRVGTSRYTAAEMKDRVSQIMWALFILNVLGYATYIIYPAAPPWYVELYGLGPADLNAAPSPARTVRFDELLGVTYFANMYSKNANVFGAIPSLHSAYPVLALFYSIKFRSLILFSTIYVVITWFGAVYLNHHYIIDAVIGGIYAVIVGLILDRYNEWKLNK